MIISEKSMIQNLIAGGKEHYLTFQICKVLCDLFPTAFCQTFPRNYGH
jgi:hypothetical protein